MAAVSYTPHEAFDLLRDWMEDEDYRVYWADALDRHDEQDFAIVFDVPNGEVRHVVPVDYFGCERAYAAFWRLVRWNNRRLDLGKH